jgi:hypothetical protein
LFYLGDLAASQVTDSEALGVNDSNIVVGWGKNGSGQIRPMVWQATNPLSRPIELPITNGDPILAGATTGEARSINNVGTAAGFVRRTNGKDVAVVWPAAGNALPPVFALPSSFHDHASVATAVSEAGIIVGRVETSPGSNVFVPYVNASGVVTILNTAGGSSGEAIAVSGSRICGWVNIAGNDRASVWTESLGAWNHSFVPLPPNSANPSRAFGVNASGQIVGSFFNAQRNRVRGFFFDGVSSTELAVLGNLVSDSAVARDINDQGWIVGENTTELIGTRPFVSYVPQGSSTRIVRLLNTGLSDADNGYFIGRTERAYAISNVLDYDLGGSVGQAIPSIAIQGSSVPAGTIHAVVARAKDIGVELPIEGAMIGGARASNGSNQTILFNPGEPLVFKVVSEVRLQNRLRVSRFMNEESIVDFSLSTPLSGGAGGTSLIPEGQSETPLISRSSGPEDAGKSGVITGSVRGSSRLLDTLPYRVQNLVSELDQLSVVPDPAFLGDPVTLSARLRYVYGANRFAIEGQTIVFSVSPDGGVTWFDAGQAVSGATGVASATYLLPPNLGSGTKVFRAEYAGRTSGSAYPYYDPATPATRNFTALSNTVVEVGTPIFAERGEWVTVSATLVQNPGGIPVPGKSLRFNIGGQDYAIVVTDLAGYARVDYPVSLQAPLNIPVLVAYEPPPQDPARGNIGLGTIKVGDAEAQARLLNWLMPGSVSLSTDVPFGSLGRVNLDGSLGEAIVNDGSATNGEAVLSAGFWYAAYALYSAPITGGIIRF